MNVDIGFEPDEVWLYTAVGGTELLYHWLRTLYDDAVTGLYGILDTAGAKSHLTTADTGIIPYDGRKMPQVLVESPVPEAGDLAVPCHNYAYQIANTVTPTARAATVIGTMVRPDTANGYVYECTTSSGACSVEPTWPTTPGDTVQDSASNVWTCREENIALTGGMGFTIGVSICTDNEILTFTAEQHDKYGDMGDANGQDPVKFPARGK
jgi:hypothetical protein